MELNLITTRTRRKRKRKRITRMTMKENILRDGIQQVEMKFI